MCAAEFTAQQIQSSLDQAKQISLQNQQKENLQTSGKKLTSLLKVDIQKEYLDKGKVFCFNCFDYAGDAQSTGAKHQNEQSIINSVHYNSDQTTMVGVQPNKGELSQISKGSLNQTTSSKGGVGGSAFNHNSQMSNSSHMVNSNLNNNNLGSNNMILAGIKEEEDYNVIENEKLP